MDQALALRVRTEVERTIQRSIKGLELLSASDPPVGLTPRDTIYSRGTLKLHHYRPATPEVYRIPVLLVMSLVSRPYILDLTPGQSFIEYLTKQGFDVFMIDWGVPRPEDSHLCFEDYVLDFIPDCAERVRAVSGEPHLNMIGYCMGGQLAAMYAALHPEGPLNALVCFTTPVNSGGMGLMKQWSDPRYFDVDRVVDTLGNVPAELIFVSFDMLRPISRMAGRLQLWDNMWNDEFVKSFRLLDRWAADQIPFPGECFRQSIKDFMWGNKLVKGEFEIGGRPVLLSNVEVPFLHIVGEHDHIVPYAAAKDLVPMVGSRDKEEIMLKGGHVSLVAGGNALYRLWPKVDQWLSARSV
ncbi:MAG: alpha/beta fold hydrolase [Chloroflexi bacterium]|nr:alpha/beta fold hydrolase [Chloroflexota bacterium]